MKPGDVGETAELDLKATRNERVKLTSAWLNTIGAAAVTTGFIGPIVAYGLNVTVVPGSRVVLRSLFCGACFGFWPEAAYIGLQGAT